MPRAMIDYSNTTFYKLVCKDLNVKDCYIGHTTNFTKRKHKHKHCCNNSTNPKHHQKVYTTIRDNGGWDNWSMVEIKTIPCRDKLEATKIEREIYESVFPTMNSDVPSRTRDEWLETNKDRKKELDKYYYQNNLEQCKEKMKRYRETHKESLKETYKQYYETNKDKLKQKNNNYYHSNKDKLTEPISCVCGAVFQKKSKPIHIKTKKHQEYLKSQEL